MRSDSEDVNLNFSAKLSSKAETETLKEEYSIHKQVWTHVSELPNQVSVPRLINFHTFEPHKAVSSFGLSIDLPTTEGSYYLRKYFMTTRMKPNSTELKYKYKIR
jgi:hypothetical protein